MARPILQPLVIGALISLCGACSGLETRPDQLRGVIAGEVIGGLGGSIGGATVSTIPPTRTVRTDSAGRFVLDGIAVGDYIVSIARDGATVGIRGRARSEARPIIARLPIWRIVWSDEFDSTDIDDVRWNIHEGPSGVEGHLQRYRRSAISVSGGRMRITTVPDSTEPGFYDGALIQSRRMFTYGRFEVRAKLPTGQGLWPAHWLWSNHTAPEIDIMEMLGGNPRKFHMTYHYGNARGTRRSTAKTFHGPDLSRDYHVYALEWYPGECRWFFDGVEVFRTHLIQPDEPLSLIIDTIVGGSWGGPPDETTRFPQYHDVDYARVYEAVE